MKLRTRIPVYLGFILLIMLAGVYFTVAFFIFQGAQEIETTTMVNSMDDTLKAIGREATAIQTTTEDYAAWDDTYNYVKKPNQAYIDANMGSDSFTNLQMNIAAIFNLQGQLIYSKDYDWMNSKDLPMPKDFMKILSKYPELFQFKGNTDQHSEFINFDGIIMFVATRPIVTSNFTGPVDGTFMYTRNFDPSYVSKLSTLTGLNITMDTDVSPASLASLFAPDKVIAPNTQRVIQFVGNNEMVGVFTLKDSDGNVLAVLTIDRDRPVNMLALGSIWTMFLVLGLLLSLLIIGSLILLDRLIFRRLFKLSSAVVHYQSDPTLLAQMGVIGKDELTSLITTIKSSFQELNSAEKKIHDHANKINLERKKLDTVLKSIAEGVFVVDKKGKILLINQTVKDFSGKSFAALLNAPFYKYLKFSDENGEFLDMNFLKPVFQHGQVVYLEDKTSFQVKDGKTIHVSLSAAPVKNDHSVISAVVVFRDMTHEYEVDKMKSEFISLASHQLRTPLTSIKWMVSLLMHSKEAKLTKDELSYLHNISSSSERMIQLVTDLLNISHIENENSKNLQKKPVDLKRMIRDVLAEQENIALDHGITLKSHFPKSSVLLQADGDKLYQAIMNIVNNAIKYSKRGGDVEMNSKIEGDHVLISVQDSGIGVPEAQQHRIFEKFFRADNVKPGVSGTGLGLYYVKTVIEAHGGKIWFTSATDKGTTFYISLPLSS